MAWLGKHRMAESVSAMRPRYLWTWLFFCDYRSFSVSFVVFLVLPFHLPFPTRVFEPAGQWCQSDPRKPHKDAQTRKPNPLPGHRAEMKPRTDVNHGKIANSTNALDSRWTEIPAIRCLPSHVISLHSKKVTLKSNNGSSQN
jgi:hypothetical protein